MSSNRFLKYVKWRKITHGTWPECRTNNINDTEKYIFFVFSKIFKCNFSMNHVQSPVERHFILNKGWQHFYGGLTAFLCKLRVLIMFWIIWQNTWGLQKGNYFQRRNFQLEWKKWDFKPENIPLITNCLSPYDEIFLFFVMLI